MAKKQFSVPEVIEEAIETAPVVWAPFTVFPTKRHFRQWLLRSAIEEGVLAILEQIETGEQLPLEFRFELKPGRRRAYEAKKQAEAIDAVLAKAAAM